MSCEFLADASLKEPEFPLFELPKQYERQSLSQAAYVYYPSPEQGERLNEALKASVGASLETKTLNQLAVYLRIQGNILLFMTLICR